MNFHIALSVVRFLLARALAIAPPILLAACTTLPDRLTLPAALVLRQPAANFTATGRIAARDTGDSNRGFSGGFAWTHKSVEDVVELWTPLGQIAARVTMTVAGAEIEYPDRRRTIAASTEEYLSEAIGVALPLSALPHWLQAMPLVRVPYRAETDSKGRLVTLWQNGWQISYTDYSDETTSAYPTRMRLSQGDIEARMIITEWTSR